MISRRTCLQAASAAALTLGLPLAARASARARIGLVLPITGVQANVAKELLTGYQLAAHLAAKRDGVTLELVVEDDKSESARTAEAVRKLGLDRSILAVSGIVGTPHAQAAIPEARAAQVPIVGIRSGAGQLRDGKGGVYHLRASYEAELTRMLRMMRDTTPDVAVVYSKDAFGQGAIAHLQREANRLGVRLVAAVAADRNGGDIEAVVRRVMAPEVGAKALVLLMITRPAVAGLRVARAEGFFGPTFTMSFTATNELLAAGPEVIRGLGLVSAFPIPRSSVDRVASDFRQVAAQLGNDDVVSSITALEGFTYGSTVAAAVAHTSRDVGREALVKALTARPGVRLGADLLAFDESQAARTDRLQVVYFDRYGSMRA